MRVDYTNRVIRSSIYELFDTSFPRLSERIAIAESYGARWHEVSTAFVAFVDGCPVAHAGVLEIPLVVNGRRCTVAGVHAVCTRPEHRGRGHARGVLEEALAWVDGRFEAAILTTGIPGMYESFGFRVVPEFVASPAAAPPRRTGPQARPLDGADPGDVALLWKLLAERSPVSNVLASVDRGWLAITNEVLASWGLRRVYMAEDLEAALVLDVENGTLRLLDVIARAIPDLDSILRRVPLEYERVELHFSPDRLGGGRYLTSRTSPDDCVMLRGPLELRGDVRLPPLARC